MSVKNFVAVVEHSGATTMYGRIDNVYVCSITAPAPVPAKRLAGTYPNIMATLGKRILGMTTIENMIYGIAVMMVAAPLVRAVFFSRAAAVTVAAKPG